MSTYEVETTIRGGLPVIMELGYDPADPSVGIFSDCFYLEKAYWVKKGKHCNYAGNELPDHIFDAITDEEVQAAEDKFRAQADDDAGYAAYEASISMHAMEWY